MPRSDSSRRFEITLRDNGMHSFVRGIEAYDAYERSKDMMLLKDGVMFVHHGVELLLKELLITHSEYLIFENLTTAAQQQKQANAQGVGVFSLPLPPKTVTYTEAINRVEAFIQVPELDKSLRKTLDELNQLRNRLEHYAVDVDTEQVMSLLVALRGPLLTLFEKYIGGIVDRLTPEAVQVLERAEKRVGADSELEDEIIQLVGRFDGQRVPGEFFGVEGEIILPRFERVLPSTDALYMGSPDHGFDIYCEGPQARWAIDVRSGLFNLHRGILEALRTSAQGVRADTCWTVMGAEPPAEFQACARTMGVLLTAGDRWNQLHRLVMGQSSAAATLYDRLAKSRREVSESSSPDPP